MRGTLEVRIHNVAHAYGTLWIGVYPSEQAFLDKSQATLLARRVVRRGAQSVELTDLPYGDYAVALFHDLNGNNELDLNWVGIPQEPYAFSRPPASKWRLPYFGEVKVSLAQPHQRISTTLTNW